MSHNVAHHAWPIIQGLLGPEPPLRVTFWDGSTRGSTNSPVSLKVRSPDAIRRLLWAPGELGLGRAYVAGDLDVDGSVFNLLDLRDVIGERDPNVQLALGLRTWLKVAGAAGRLGLIGPPLPPPPEEARLQGRLHGRRRDRAAISHHYDVGNDFYRLVLGSSMTYSCAYFPNFETSLAQAQEAKNELVCTKLGLQPGQRLLDVGCGWGGLAIHAATHHGVDVVGITLSSEQASLARRRVAAAGIAEHVEIRVADYRDAQDGPFDAIASIGMFEHVGLSRIGVYSDQLMGLLAPRGRLLNHAISRTSGNDPLGHNTFVSRYVFPDGHVVEVGRVISAMQDAGLECRDVESIREHYARTLRCWVANLESERDQAVELVGSARARIWLLYMAGAAVAFEGHRLNVHQVLLTRTDEMGGSGMPPTRRELLRASPGVPNEIDVTGRTDRSRSR